jgi:hypothetical protein
VRGEWVVGEHDENMNIVSFNKFSVTGHQTEHSHRSDEIILPRSFPGEGNACLPPSETFAHFKCKRTGRWRSVRAERFRGTPVATIVFNHFIKPQLS